MGLIKDNTNNNDNNNELNDKNDAIAVEQNEDEDSLIEEDDDIFDTIEQDERHEKDHIDTHIIKSEQQQQQQQQQEPTVDDEGVITTNMNDSTANWERDINLMSSFKIPSPPTLATNLETSEESIEHDGVFSDTTGGDTTLFVFKHLRIA